MCELKISEIQIVPLKAKDGLVGFASCVLDGSIFLGNIAIHSCLKNPGDFRLVYPSKKLSSEKKINIFHPIHKEAGGLLSKSIIGKFKELMVTEEE